MGAALSFAGPLLLAGLAALIHSVFPFLLVGTSSKIIDELHNRMVVNRVRTVPRGQPRA